MTRDRSATTHGSETGMSLCSVFEMDESLAEEPRYIPHGLVWIKAQMLLFMEARAKTIEAPSDENQKERA